MLLVEDIMQTRVQATAPGCPVADAARLMRDEGVGCVVVVEGHHPVGLVTDRDLAVRVVAAGRSSTVRVGEIMSREVISCRPDESAAEALRTMRVHLIRRIVVARSDRLVGIVSLCDFAACAPRIDDIDLTLADLCQEAAAPSAGGATDHRAQEARHP